MLVYENIRNLPAQERQDFIWDKIVYANPIKPKETLRSLGPVQAAGHLSTTSRSCARSAPTPARRPGAGVCAFPNTGSMVELFPRSSAATQARPSTSSREAFRIGLVVEGVSFHVGSQCTNFREFRCRPSTWAAAVMREAKARGFEIKILVYRRRLSRPLQPPRPPIGAASEKESTPKFARLFPADLEILAEPRPFPGGHRGLRRRPRHRQGGTATPKRAITSTTASTTPSPASSSTTASTTSNAFKRGPTEICAVFGQTLRRPGHQSPNPKSLPNLEIEDLVFSDNIGAYSKRLRHLVQRLPPSQSGARQRVGRGMSGERSCRWRRKILSRSAYQPTACSRGATRAGRFLSPGCYRAT